jgi:DNA-binding NtrC family response regulator
LEKQILVFAEDPIVRHTKQLVLEHLGFSVISVATLRELDYVLAKSLFDLAIIGRTVTDPHKLLAATSIRTKFPNLPILEICNISPCISNPDYVLRSPNPEDLAEMVQSILLRKTASESA